MYTRTMAGSPDKEKPDFYEPGNPRTFGNPPNTVGLGASLRASSERYSSLSARMRLLHGQDPTIKGIYQIMRRDRLLSIFPEVQQGVQFLDEVLPKFIEECQGNQLASSEISGLPEEFDENKEGFFGQFLFDFFTGHEEAEVGGQEVLYLFMDRPPQAQSYEYLGERLMKITRKEPVSCTPST